MSSLYDKSKQNTEASLRNFEFGCFAPTVHSAYYSCLQKVLAILEQHFKKSYSDIVSNGIENRSSTHVHTIDTFWHVLKDYNKNDASTFKGKMSDLKGFRVDSDYTPKVIDKEHAEKAIKTGKEIHALINKYFT